MSRKILFPLLAPALLAGCYGTQNRGIESVHQPVVARTAFALDLGLSGDALAPGEAQRLAGWMASLDTGYGDRIAVDDPSGIAGTARAEIAQAAAALGLMTDAYAPVTAGGIAPGTVRVTVSRSSASVPGCPDHSRPATPNFDAHTSSNFGCSINSNLAAMVARPDDLVRGQQGTGTTDPIVSGKAIDQFRRAAPTGGQGLKAEAAAGGR